jgi:AcrR family transcriptional regulator
MESETGLRERKKARTRHLIEETALRLFSKHGFESVTVADIARAAEVAEKTVFNYFPTKEDLVFARLEAFETELLDAVRNRRPGEPAVDAFVSFVAHPKRLLAERERDAAASNRLRAGLRVITSSPALLAREQLVYARFTDALALQLRRETRAEADDPKPWLAAHAMMGIHQELVKHVRARALAGASNRTIGLEVGSRARAGLRLLRRGLGRYAAKAKR